MGRRCTGRRGRVFRDGVGVVDRGECTMPFGGFSSLGEVALRYQITLRPHAFVQPIPMAVDETLRRHLEFDRLNAPVSVSEQAIGEFLIAPILKEMWRAYSDA